MLYYLVATLYVLTCLVLMLVVLTMTVPVALR